MAKLGHCPSKEFQQWFFQNSQPRLDSFSALELSNIINFMAKLNARPSDPSYLSSYIQAAYNRLNEFAPQGLANLIHGFGQLGYDPGGMFMDAFFRCLSRQLSRNDFSFLGLALVMNGLGNLRYHPGSMVLNMLSERCQALAPTATWSTLALVLNGMAILDYTPPQDFWSVIGRPLPPGRVPLTELASILFSLSVMDSTHSRHLLSHLLPLALPLIQHDLDRAKGPKPTLESSRFRQLCQVAIYLQTRKTSTTAEEAAFIDMVMSQAAPKVAWNHTAYVSKLHLDVARTVESILGLPCELEVPHHHSVFILDMVVQPPPEFRDAVKPVVIEVDGPTHFLANQGHRPTGRVHW